MARLITLPIPYRPQPTGTDLELNKAKPTSSPGTWALCIFALLGGTSLLSLWPSRFTLKFFPALFA